MGNQKKKLHKQVVIEVQEAYSKIKKEKDMESILNLHNIESSKLIEENQKLEKEINNLRQENEKNKSQSNFREKKMLKSIIERMKVSKKQSNDISSIGLQDSEFNYEEKSSPNRFLTARNKERMKIHKGDCYNFESGFSIGSNENEIVVIFFIEIQNYILGNQH